MPPKKVRRKSEVTMLDYLIINLHTLVPNYHKDNNKYANT